MENNSVQETTHDCLTTQERDEDETKTLLGMSCKWNWSNAKLAIREAVGKIRRTEKTHSSRREEVRNILRKTLNEETHEYPGEYTTFARLKEETKDEVGTLLTQDTSRCVLTSLLWYMSLELVLNPPLSRNEEFLTRLGRLCNSFPHQFVSYPDSCYRVILPLDSSLLLFEDKKEVWPETATSSLWEKIRVRRSCMLTMKKRCSSWSRDWSCWSPLPVLPEILLRAFLDSSYLPTYLFSLPLVSLSRALWRSVTGCSGQCILVWVSDALSGVKSGSWDQAGVFATAESITRCCCATDSLFTWEAHFWTSLSKNVYSSCRPWRTDLLNYLSFLCFCLSRWVFVAFCEEVPFLFSDVMMHLACVEDNYQWYHSRPYTKQSFSFPLFVGEVYLMAILVIRRGYSLHASLRFQDITWWLFACLCLINRRHAEAKVKGELLHLIHLGITDANHRRKLDEDLLPNLLSEAQSQLLLLL